MCYMRQRQRAHTHKPTNALTSVIMSQKNMQICTYKLIHIHTYLKLRTCTHFSAVVTQPSRYVGAKEG